METKSEIPFKIEKKKTDAPKLEVKSQKGLTLLVFSFLVLNTWRHPACHHLPACHKAILI